MAENGNKYGNVTLGQIAHFAVDVCGRDALLDFDPGLESNLPDLYREKGSYRNLRYSDASSIFGTTRKFLYKLEEEFKLELIPSDHYCFEDGKKTIKTENHNICYDFIDCIIQNYISAIKEFGPFEDTQEKASEAILCTVLLNDESEEMREFIRDCSKPSFKTLLEEYVKNQGIHYEGFYTDIENRLEEHDLENSGKDIKRSLVRCRSIDEFPKWRILHPLIKYILKQDPDCAGKLLSCYLYSNFKKALDLLAITPEFWAGMERLCENPRIIPQESFYSNLSLSPIQDIESCSFTSHWTEAGRQVHAFLEYGEPDSLKKALEEYETAFSYRYVAGSLLENFLHEAVAVSAYYDFRNSLKQARNRVRNSSSSEYENKTPLGSKTKKFYDFGFALDLFASEMEKSYSAYYMCRENFWGFFGSFSNSETARRLKEEDYTAGIVVLDSEHLQVEVPDVTPGKINNLQPSDRMVSYTPISQAIAHEQFEEVKRLLDNPKTKLDVPNSNNSYPIHEILTKYKYRRVDRSLVDRILDKTSPMTLKAESNNRKFSALQLAMDSFDPELVQRVVEKMLGSNPYFKDDYRITSDEESPLYYAIQLKHFGLMVKSGNNLPFPQYENIKWDNLAVPGFSASEKASYLKSANELFGPQLSEAVFKQEYCYFDEESADEIIKYIASKTRNVDAFVLKTKEGTQGCNALLLACEYNDVSTCKSLLKHGANTSIILGYSSLVFPSENKELYYPNDCIFRSIWFRAWDTLEFLLNELINKKKKYLQPEKSDMDPLNFLIIVLLNSKLQQKEVGRLLNWFQPLFIAAGAVTKKLV